MLWRVTAGGGPNCLGLCPGAILEHTAVLLPQLPPASVWLAGMCEIADYLSFLLFVKYISWHCEVNFFSHPHNLYFMSV